MWQKRADTQTHRFTKLLETRQKQMPVVTEKRNSKQTDCPKEPVVFWCILFFRSIQFKDSKFQNEIPKQQFLFLCWLSYLCFILQHLIQEEDTPQINSITPPVLFLTYPTAYRHYLIVCTSCVKSQYSSFKKKQKYKRKSQNTFSHGWCSIYVPSHCIETLLRSAAPGGGSGKGEQTQNRRKNEDCPQKHQIEKTNKDSDQNRKSKGSTSCVVVQDREHSDYLGHRSNQYLCLDQLLQHCLVQ